jgi:hypothetical protein
MLYKIWHSMSGDYLVIKRQTARHLASLHEKIV